MYFHVNVYCMYCACTILYLNLLVGISTRMYYVLVCIVRIIHMHRYGMYLLGLVLVCISMY